MLRGVYSMHKRQRKFTKFHLNCELMNLPRERLKRAGKEKRDRGGDRTKEKGSKKSVE